MKKLRRQEDVIEKEKDSWEKMWTFRQIKKSKDNTVHIFTVHSVSVHKCLRIVLIHYSSTCVQIHKQRKENLITGCIKSIRKFCWWQTQIFESQRVCPNKPEKHIFLCRLNASRTDLTAVWSITHRTFEPVNATRRLHIWQDGMEGIKGQYLCDRGRLFCQLHE